MALIAAFLILTGVSKVPPAAKPITSLPCAFKALALAVIAKVSDGLIFAIHVDNRTNYTLPLFLILNFSINF